MSSIANSLTTKAHLSTIVLKLYLAVLTITLNLSKNLLNSDITAKNYLFLKKENIFNNEF
jgi:hypothetical protein